MFLLLCACNCNNNKKEKLPEPVVKQKDLSFFGSSDTLIFAFTDEKCGEWGGETRSIYIYKTISKHPYYNILADLTEYHMDCDSIVPEAEPKVGFSRKKIQINEEHTELITEAMEEYFELKLNFDEEIIGHSGCFSGMKTTDGKMYMTLYPSPRWKTFDLLFKKLKNQDQ